MPRKVLSAPLLMLISLAALGACSGKPEPTASESVEAGLDNSPIVEPGLPLPANSDLPMDPGTASPLPPMVPPIGPAPEAAPATGPASGDVTIPVIARGRFGLVRGDCTSTRGDNKGLIAVSATRIRFYESVADLKTVKERSPTRIRATFAYEGEGMKWRRDTVLDVQDGGRVLILREYGDGAPPGPRRYLRCELSAVSARASRRS